MLPFALMHKCSCMLKLWTRSRKHITSRYDSLSKKDFWLSTLLWRFAHTLDSKMDHIQKSIGFRSGEEVGHSSVDIKSGTLRITNQMSLFPCGREQNLAGKPNACHLSAYKSKASACSPKSTLHTFLCQSSPFDQWIPGLPTIRVNGPKHYWWKFLSSFNCGIDGKIDVWSGQKILLFWWLCAISTANIFSS